MKLLVVLFELSRFSRSFDEDLATNNTVNTKHTLDERRGSTTVGAQNDHSFLILDLERDAFYGEDSEQLPVDDDDVSVVPHESANFVPIEEPPALKVSNRHNVFFDFYFLCFVSFSNNIFRGVPYLGMGQRYDFVDGPSCVAIEGAHGEEQEETPKEHIGYKVDAQDAHERVPSVDIEIHGGIVLIVQQHFQIME